MANRRFVSSLGDPYFAMKAEGVGDLSVLPSFGLASVSMEFRVDSLPQQSASADELHALFAFDHDLPTQPRILEVGVTPSGRIKAECRTGSVWQSGTARVVGSNQWHTLEVVYDSGTGVWAVTFDTDATDTGTTDPSPAPLLPNAGYNTRLMLFNGREGLTRMRASIRRLFLSFVGGGGSTTLLYDFADDYGALLEPEFGGTVPDGIPADCVMAAAFYNPLIFSPWGTVPSGSASGAYRWGLGTEYTLALKPTTRYTRVPA